MPEKAHVSRFAASKMYPRYSTVVVSSNFVTKVVGAIYTILHEFQVLWPPKRSIGEVLKSDGVFCKGCRPTVVSRV